MVRVAVVSGGGGEVVKMGGDFLGTTKFTPRIPLNDHLVNRIQLFIHLMMSISYGLAYFFKILQTSFRQQDALQKLRTASMVSVRDGFSALELVIAISYL
jgi:hypothetical protein